jgi:AraC family transcriptional regulator of adaptative response / methylphosphotriester-DNA alkyltransferase methyltransferase
MQRRTTIEARRALFEEASAIVALEYPARLELAVVARRLATSPRQLQRAFTEAGGTTFRTYLRAVRMEQAEDLLRDGCLRVREVAGAVGYSQPAQFAKAFRRHHGRPPSALRIAAKAGEASQGPRGARKRPGVRLACRQVVDVVDTTSLRDMEPGRSEIEAERMR